MMCISYFQSDHMIHIIYIYGIPIFLAACALHINTQFYTCTLNFTCGTYNYKRRSTTIDT